jgi:hypothetical protein
MLAGLPGILSKNKPAEAIKILEEYISKGPPNHLASMAKKGKSSHLSTLTHYRLFAIVRPLAIRAVIENTLLSRTIGDHG